MRILIFGDIPGIPQLLRHIPTEHIVGLVCAAIRPQYHVALAGIAKAHKRPWLIQPKVNSVDYDAFKAAIRDLTPDLFLVNSYSMILRADILSMARFGGLNIHGALLPRYRGCNPTQWAILKSETRTGVTLHEVSVGLDEGAIVDQREVPLYFEDTWQTVNARIASATDELIAANLESIVAGYWQAKPQDNTKANYCQRRTPDDGLFSWAEPVISIYNKIRALLPPLPAAFYLDVTGTRVPMAQQLTPWEVTALKYGSVGGRTLAAKRICLHTMRREDSALLYECVTNRELETSNAEHHLILGLDHEAWIDSMLKQRFDLVLFVIMEIVTGKAIGICQLFNTNWQHRSAELQICITDKRHIDMGLDGESVKMLCKFGFDDLNLHRIFVRVFDSKIDTIDTYRKCGFVQEGLLREAATFDGEWVDVAIMGLINDDK